MYKRQTHPRERRITEENEETEDGWIDGRRSSQRIQNKMQEEGEELEDRQRPSRSKQAYADFVTCRTAPRNELMTSSDESQKRKIQTEPVDLGDHLSDLMDMNASDSKRCKSPTSPKVTRALRQLDIACKSPSKRRSVDLCGHIDRLTFEEEKHFRSITIASSANTPGHSVVSGLHRINAIETDKLMTDLIQKNHLLKHYNVAAMHRVIRNTQTHLASTRPGEDMDPSVINEYKKVHDMITVALNAEASRQERLVERTQGELYQQNENSKMFLGDLRHPEMPNLYQSYLQKDEDKRDPADLYKMAKVYEKDIKNKTDILKQPSPKEPLSPADTCVKTMRKYIVVLLENSETYLIRIRQAIKDHEVDKAMEARKLATSQIVAQPVLSHNDRTEVSQENPSQKTHSMMMSSAIVTEACPKSHSGSTPAEQLVKPMSEYARDRLPSLPTIAQRKTMVTSLVQPKNTDQEIKAGSSIMAKGGPQENEEPSRINLSTSQQPKETFTNKTMVTALSHSHDQRSENIIERQPYHPSHLKNPATAAPEEYDP